MWYNSGMNTENPQTDSRSFYQFLGQRIEHGASELSPEQSVAEYRAYQNEVQRFLKESQPAFDEAARGEAKELDHDALLARVRTRLAAKGISD